MNNLSQGEFDLTIGRLDRVLSVLVGFGRGYKRKMDGDLLPDVFDEPNAQTLKHHAEDMIAAGQKILKDLGKSVEATPQP